MEELDMARYPGASWRPLASDWRAQPAIAGPDLLVLHTMVGSLSGTDSYFRGNGYVGTESHFGVGHDGTTYQWQDTTRRAEANLNANDNAISIETADVGTGFPVWNTNNGSQVPAWTSRQLDRLVDLIAWACRAHDIPCVLVPDSRAGRRGIGYHRQGVPLRRGATVSQTGGELWSTAVGKVCPGDRRIAQIPTIIGRARAVLAGQEEDIMATAAELRQIVREEVAAVARRRDVGFARDQILTRLGVDDTVGAPDTMPPEELAAIEPARRVDIGYALDELRRENQQLRAEIVELRALLEAPTPSGADEERPDRPAEPVGTD